jgi:aminomethyltransferase
MEEYRLKYSGTPPSIQSGAQIQGEGNLMRLRRTKRQVCHGDYRIFSRRIEIRRQSSVNVAPTLRNSTEHPMSDSQTNDIPTTPLKSTPLDTWHRSNGGVMVPFAGYEMPIRYSSIVGEHQACRQSAALFDVSHMGRLRFEGVGAERLLDHLLTRRISDMPVGGVRYGLICNAEGGVLDDVLVSHLETPSGGRYHLMVVNASNREKILRWIVPHLADFPTVTVSDRTELTAMMAIQGPKAISVCSRLFDFDPQRLKNYRAKMTAQFGKPVIVSRTGYTGEDGLELIVRAEDATRVWENLLLVGREQGFMAAGLGARDTLRMEAAMPLYGHELDESIDPLSAGLGFACDLENRSFIGDESLREISQRGVSQVRIGLLPEGKRPAREGCPILDSVGTVVGKVTSGGPSPTLDRPIAMGYVRSEVAQLSHFQIDIRGNLVSAARVELPFYRRSR